MAHPLALALHGGAGTILKEQMTAELEAAYHQSLQTALQAGWQALMAGLPAVEVVALVVEHLENDPLYNAGRGSVFTHQGLHEMDAAIMCGHTLAAGACAGVQQVQNPVRLAQAIMNNSEHVMLAGQGAQQFALEQGLPLQPNSYFYTPFRHSQWQHVRDTGHYALDHNLNGIDALMHNKKFGTVGAVALDANGHIAAATSTGGMTNKQYNRIGDSPIIGSGCYANNKTCAISSTGHGEIFIKAVAAYDVSCLMEYAGLSLQQAMEKVVMDKLVRMQGEGGMIGLDAKGQIGMVFNSAGMYRAARNSQGVDVIGIYG